jgi:hypothetical protein
MAWTNWLGANSITKFQDDSVIMDTVGLISLEPIYGVAVSNGNINQYGSEALLFKNFLSSGTATMIQANIKVDRVGRIQDKVIQLYNGDTLVGKNNAYLAAENVHVYEWDNVSYTLSNNFGIVIDYQPNISTPSRERLIIRSVLLRFFI